MHVKEPIPKCIYIALNYDSTLYICFLGIKCCLGITSYLGIICMQGNINRAKVSLEEHFKLHPSRCIQ